MGYSKPRTVHRARAIARHEEREADEEMREARARHTINEIYEVQALALGELKERFEDPARRRKMSDFALNAIHGTLVDKIAKHEAWGQPKVDQNGPQAWFTAFARALSENGVKLSLEVSKPPTAIEAQVVPATFTPLALTTADG